MTIQEKYEYGLNEILRPLFELSAHQVKEKLKEICGTLVPDHVFEEDAVVTKITKDDAPASIEVSFYDTIEVHPFGISYKPEHGSYESIIEFNKFFKLA